MKLNQLIGAGVALGVTLASLTCATSSNAHGVGTGKIQHVLLLSIDGMHAVDFYNCAHGIEGVNGGDPYCPNLAGLEPARHQLRSRRFLEAFGFLPGLAALVTGGSPKSTGLYYDVAYDRSLDAPATTTGTGLAGGSCSPYGIPTGTTTDYDQGIDFDDTKLNGGAPGAAATEGGAASIDPTQLVRDPQTGLRAGVPLELHPHEHDFRRGARGGRLYGLDRQAPVLFDGRPDPEARAWTTSTRPK